MCYSKSSRSASEEQISRRCRELDNCRGSSEKSPLEHGLTAFDPRPALPLPAQYPRTALQCCTAKDISRGSLSTLLAGRFSTTCKAARRHSESSCCPVPDRSQ